MAARIEDQIHKFLVDQEEERCRAIEAQYDSHEDTRGKKEKRKKVTNTWKRAGEAALCQDIDFLRMVTEYDYDLPEKPFQEYCASRGVLHVAGEPGGTRWQFVADFGRTKDAYMSDPFFQFAIEVKGERQRYSDKEMEIGWHLVVLARATIQDCWELYSQKAESTKHS